MKSLMANDVIFTAPMVGAAIWTTVTGDTFLPSIVGGAFAVYFRMERKGDEGYVWKDLIATGVMSILVGLIAGPYVGSQLPDGEGVVGVGSLIASFLGTAFLSKLNRMEWDIGAVLRAVLSALPRKNGK